MLEAFNNLVSFAFAELNVKSVIGRTLKINTQAITLVLKLGFRRLKVNGDELILIKTNNGSVVSSSANNLVKFQI
jgi:RimJ/RimL family protein N-acetyltransferase